MPGGTLSVEVDDEFRARMSGPVGRVAEGWLCEEALQGQPGPDPGDGGSGKE
jgi:hypothetical protein